VELDKLSDWVTSVRSLIQKRIFKLSRFMSSKVRSIFNDKDVVDNLTDIHSKYVVVPADKASNNIVFVCKIYYIDCLVKELGINNNTGNPTKTPTSLSKDGILFNHKSYSYCYSWIECLFVKDHTNCKTKYTEDYIVNMINFLIDNMFL